MRPRRRGLREALHGIASRRAELHRQWHAQWHEKVQGKRRWRRSLRIRLVMMFVMLALVMAAVFMGGMKKSFSTGWAEAAKPMLVDYAD